jgi:vacuolar-type H+-ATPase subunit I/STV1
MKLLTLALCVIAILGSAASTFFYFQIGNTKDQLKQQVIVSETQAKELQTKLGESGAQTEVLQKRLAELDGDLGDAKSKATAAEGRSTQLTRDVAQLRNQITAKGEAEQALNSEISQLKRELAQAKLSSISSSPEEVDGYKSTIATLQARVTELESNSSRNTSVTTTANTTASGATQVVDSPAGLTGEVVSIGNQDAFVVLNIGSAKGVQVGQKLSITRKGAVVAESQISSVQEAYSVAQITPGSIRGGLSKGDVASVVQ